MTKIVFTLTTKHGTIGEVDLDFDKLPEASKAYIVNYGVRKTLQDAIAACKDNVAEAKGLFDKRLDSLKNGTLGQRTASPASALEKEVLRLAEIAVKAAAKAKGLVISKLDPKQLKDAISRYADKHRERLEKDAKKNLDALAKLDIGLDDDADIFAGLGDSEAPSDESADEEAGA